MGLISYANKLIQSFSEDEVDKWIRFHDELDERCKRNLKDVVEGKAFSSPDDFVLNSHEKNNNYETGGITLEEGGRHIDRLGAILKDSSMKIDKIYMTNNEKREELLKDKSRESKNMTNIFNNQFILQTNLTKQESMYQCVVCGSFNVDNETVYGDNNISIRTINCIDCNNRLVKEY